MLIGAARGSPEPLQGIAGENRRLKKKNLGAGLHAGKKRRSRKRSQDMTASSRSGMPWEGLGRLHLSKERSQRVQKGLFKLEGPNLLLRWPQKGGSFGS
ncbi:uncharacterized protein VSU04_009390 isoform 3-T3 [Chlamydotis macqueenii]